MSGAASILVVDDDLRNRGMMAEALSEAGFAVDTACDGVEALSKAEKGAYDAVLSDIRMMLISDFDILNSLQKTMLEVPVILVTGVGSIETAIQAMQQGAFDYILKPVNLEALALIMQRAVEHRRLIQDNRRLQRVVNEQPQAPILVGRSKKMVDVFKLVGKVSQSRTSVLIEGESGTGKELIARAIHDYSPRASHRFVAVNCGALPDVLFESELFGHSKGPFTGAHVTRRGLLEEAQSGTFFLDEIGDLAPAGQAKLLRVLQEGEFRRVGSKESVRVDLRVIAASRWNLATLVDTGRFREDLLNRLNAATILVPPLRERPDDIPVLASFFLARYGEQREPPVTALSSTAMNALTKYRWPGNVRELEHVIERTVASAPHTVLSFDDLSPEVRQKGGDPSHWGSTSPGTLKAIEKEQVLKTLKAMHGNKERTAQLFGISRRTLYRLIERYSLDQYGPRAEADDSRPIGFSD